MGTRWSSSFLALNYLAMPPTEAIPKTSLEAHGAAAGHQCSERQQTAPETFGVDAAGAEPLCWPSSSREFTLPLRSHGRSILLPHFSFLFPLPQRKGVVPDTSLNLFSHQSEQHTLALLLGWKLWLPKKLKRGMQQSLHTLRVFGSSQIQTPPKQGSFCRFATGDTHLLVLLCPGQQHPSHQPKWQRKPSRMDSEHQVLGCSAPLSLHDLRPKAATTPVNAEPSSSPAHLGCSR